MTTYPHPTDTIAELRTPVRPLEPPVHIPGIVFIKHSPPLPPVVQRPASFAPGVQLSTHIFPAAYPRVPRCTQNPLLSAPSVNQGQQNERIRDLVTWFSDRRAAYNDGSLDVPRRGEILWTAANRYVRDGSHEGGVTLVMAHANGLHKEVRVRTSLVDSG